MPKMLVRGSMILRVVETNNYTAPETPYIEPPPEGSSGWFLSALPSTAPHDGWAGTAWSDDGAGSGTIVALRWDSPTYLTSPDGFNWVTRKFPVALSQGVYFSEVRWHLSTGFMVLIDNGQLFTSEDGIIWQQLEQLNIEASFWRFISPGPDGTFVAFRADGKVAVGSVSSPKSSWLAYDCGFRHFLVRGGVDGRTLILSTWSGSLYLSTDNGQNWTSGIAPQDYGEVQDIGWTGTHFAFLLEEQIALLKIDGFSLLWSFTTRPPDELMPPDMVITTGDKRMLVFSTDGPTAVSADNGNTWTRADPPDVGLSWHMWRCPSSTYSRALVLGYDGSEGTYSGHVGLYMTGNPFIPPLPDPENVSDLSNIQDVGPWLGTAFGKNSYTEEAVAVILGNNGVTAVSTNGGPWSYGGVVPISAAPLDIGWNSSFNFVVLANNGKLYVSNDGIAWNPAPSQLSEFASWSAFALGNNVFFALRFDGVIVTGVPFSPDYTWTQNLVSSGAAPKIVPSTGNTVLIVYASSTMYYASFDNGSSWSGYFLPFGIGGIVAAAWDGTQFLVFDDNNNASSSTDGFSWNTVSGPGLTGLTAIVANQSGHLYAFGADNTVAVSTDGAQSWTTSVQAGATRWGLPAAYGGTVFALGYNGSSDNRKVAVYETDGGGGPPVGVDGWSTHNWPLAYQWYEPSAFAHNGTKFCAVAQSTYSYTSTDGITWTQHFTGINNYYAIGRLVWNSTLGVFALLSQSGDIAVSADGATWTAWPNLPWTESSYSWQGIAPVADGFVCVTSDGQALYVNNGGMSSTMITVAPGTFFESVMSSNTGVTVANDYGSGSAYRWLDPASDFQYGWNGVLLQTSGSIGCWNGSRFWSPGAFSTSVFAYSYDGTNWTSKDIGVVSNWGKVEGTGDLLVAVAPFSGKVAVSEDEGATWTGYDMPSSFALGCSSTTAVTFKDGNLYVYNKA